MRLMGGKCAIVVKILDMSILEMEYDHDEREFNYTTNTIILVIQKI